MKQVTKPKRKPVALFTVSAVNAADVKAIKKLISAGMEVVVVQDKDFDKAMLIFEDLRNRRLESV